MPIAYNNTLYMGGGMVVPSLGTEYRYFEDNNNTVQGIINELSLVDTFGKAPGPVFILPAITFHGCVCGIKNYSNWMDVGVRVTISHPGSTLVAGILAQPVNSMTLQGNAGECAIFMGEFDPEFGNIWYLINYLAGSTVAP